MITRTRIITIYLIGLIIIFFSVTVNSLRFGRKSFMKGNSNVINQLNQILSFELSAINQYFLHARMFKNWGIEKLNQQDYKKSIQDMKHADKLIERILFLESQPNIQDLEKIKIGPDCDNMLRNDKLIVENQLVLLRSTIAICEQEKDYVSRDLLVEIQEDEEEHLDWLEAQFELVAMTGLQNYIQSQI